MRKRFFQRNAFLKFLMVLLAIGWSTSSVQAGKRADFNYRLRVKAIFGDGSPATSYVTVYGHYDAPSPAPTPSSNDYTMPSSSISEWSNCPDLNLAGTAMNGEEFVGWYLDQACTQLLCSTLTREIWSTSNAPGIGGINHYTTAAEADSHIQTIYAKFSFPPMDWSPYAEAPVVANEKKYYIYSVGLPGLVGLEEVSDGKILHCYKDPNKAVLFTLSDATNPEISCVDGGVTKYVDKGCYLRTEPTYRTLSLKEDGSYMIKLNYGNDYEWCQIQDNGRIDRQLYNEGSVKQRWMFIPEATYKSLWKVKSVKENGAITINASPTASGTTYVKFNVSGVGPVEAFDYELTDNDGQWEFGTPTCVDSVFTIPVTYTAHNVHSGTETALSTATVTLTAKNDAATHASGTVTAYVDLQPTFTMAVNELNWSTKPAGEEVYNVGMEVAASQRERLQNKLVYNTANAIAQNNATWRATIIGTNADQFKFKNGTRTVTFSPYSADSLDVIYAPTALSGEGTHSATLHIEVSYTDAASPTPQTLTCVKEVALSGKAQDVSMLTMALNGSETASNNPSLDFGDIIGTNAQTVTVDLYNHGLTNLTKAWVTNAEGAFEFDADTIKLNKANQRLVIRAHRSTPVTAAEDYEATLTISGEDSNGDPVSAVLTLNYRALPLIPTTVTWNWTLLNEDATYTNPITTNSDGEWTLVQRDGNGGMTYNVETKSITTEYMHHESGYQAKFELTIPQTDTYTARTDTFTATINAVIPHVIEIKNQGDVDTLVVDTKWGSSYASYNPTTNVLTGSSGTNVTLKWSGQNAITFDYTGSTGTGYDRRITEIYSDGTERQIYYAPFSATNNMFAISPQTAKLRLHLSGGLKDVRYFEYDTIDVNYHGVVFVDGGATTRDITATFANKRAVTVSLNAAAQPYFELRAEGKPTGSTLVYNGEDGLAVHKFVKGKKFTVAIKDGVNYADAKAAADNGFQVILQDNYTYNSEVVVLPIALEESYQVIYKHDANGSYKVTYHDDLENPHPVSTSADYKHTVSSIVETSCTATLSEPTPESGYMFRGWKVNGNLVSCKATCTVIPASGATVEPVFVPAEEAVYGIDDARFADLDEALSTAGSIADTKPVVTLLKDVTLEAATHTIPAGVTLLIPYKDDFNVLQTTPEITTTDEVLSAYRTLTLKEGANIVCNGTICVSGKIKATGGGFKSAYTTGECGVINMATGGHIELNNGAQLYCWGYIKGQDMDQGNNTQGTGTVTVNSGAIVHENFELGDWRGGTASSNIYYEKDTKHLFPFQSYALQNVEIPTTYKFGSKLETFMAVNTGFGSIPFAVSMIGSANTLFLLKDVGSVIRKWYDPTTDLTCYELSGTAQLDQLVMNLPFVGDFESGDCNLPISNSMHIILKDDLTLSKRLMQQAGSIIEIKPTATINLENELYMYDKDEWGLYIHNYYFRSFNNLTSHKDRGAEDSKEGLDDAKLIVDGILNIQNGGKLYTTAGGANVMGNGGGEIHFPQALPAATQLWAVTVKSGKPYIEWEYNNVAAANLCNEDGSYTRSIAGATFYNVHGRWFHSEDKDPDSEDHTYSFTYMVDDNPEHDLVVAAVYSHDKTGLEARMKWFNVEADENCANWWIGSNPAASYNYTMLNDWHQFIATETENVYSCSNNVLYRKDGCDWAEEGFIDENCLYTFGDVKKALVDGEFIPLTPNANDPAYHKSDDASKYYICFKGCNWHPATKYAGESKAYTIVPEAEDSLHYIWFEDDWLNVQRDGAFFYTEDEQTNVRTYYEYLNGDWIVATPYVSVSDATEPTPRTFYMIKEAFNVASIKKNATIKLLRDLTNVSEVLSFSTQNTTCTLDLNGHLLAGNIANLITVNAPGATFTITDSAAIKSGKISNAASKAVYVQKGALVVENGTIESTGAYAIEGAATTTITIKGGYFAATTKCVNVNGSCSISGGHFNLNTGLATYKAPHTNVFETTDPKYKYEVANEWTITFKDGTTTLQTLHLRTNEMPVYTEAQPTKDGYKFVGWNTSIVPATADATYTAQFEELVGNEKCITLDANGGNEGLRYVYVSTNKIGTALDSYTATKEGHTFAGWFTQDGDPIGEETPISADVTYFAHYTIAQYTLTWKLAGGTVTEAGTGAEVDATGTQSIDLNYGVAITAPTVTKADCDFLGWGVASVVTTMPAHDVTYTAQWPIIAKHFLQNINGTYPETPEATEIVSGEANAYVTPAVKTYDGFISPDAQTVRIGDTTEVTYKYARRTYTIALNANGGECATASINVKHGATPDLPVATKNGANCSGWFTKAIGGDKITNETEILYNIGTLYAQYADLTVTAPLTVSDTREVGDVRITTTGSLNITGSVTATNFILESDGSTESGQLLPVTGTLNITGHAYFDLKLNAKNHLWYGVAVPWPVDATSGISVNGRTLQLGKDFDIIYYDGARRAEQGKQKCWSYVQNDGDKTLVPGRLYMIGLMGDAAVVRFEMKDGALLTNTTSVAAHPQSTGDDTDAGWNGVANPALFHAFVNPGVTEGQVFVPNESRYEPISLNTAKFVVGQGAFVQVESGKSITVSQGAAFAAPRRAKAQTTSTFDVRIAPANDEYTITNNQSPITNDNYTDRLFIKTTDSRENRYTIGQDLAKVGVSSKVAQMWVNRYDAKLCVNTAELINETADYPLGISVPAAGDYTITNNQSPITNDQYELYLTKNGEVIWNLSEGAFVLSLEKGTTNAYGLRLNTNKMPTAIDEAVVDAQGQTRKVLINNQIFILRGDKVYSIDGQMVK